jgi:adenine-specific DNA-methyltransferase
MDKLKMHSPNLTDENVAKIRDLFPSCVTEAADENGKPRLVVDLDQLRQELSDHIVEGPQERYRLDWPGKREALLAGNAPIAKTLRPMRGESVNFDTTKNLFIEGDNLEALKLLQEIYLGNVKMIYIDPPYNTGKDFIYRDRFAKGEIEHAIQSSQRDDNQNRLVANTESSGRFHSDWLSMIYPRIRLARNLLTPDGFLFVSIGEDEVANLKKICDEIFGEQNFVSHFIWNTEGHTDNQYDVKVNHEYILLYSRSSSASLGATIDPNTRAESNLWKGYAENSITKNGSANPPSEVTLPIGFPCKVPTVSLPANIPPQSFFHLVEQSKYITRQATQQYDVSYPIRLEPMVVEAGVLSRPCRVFTGWANVEKLKQFINGKCVPIDEGDGNTLTFYLSDRGVIYYKRERAQARNIVSVLRNMGTTEKMSSELEKMGIPFPYPKPKQLMKYLLAMGAPSGGIVLDFFAGSGTTAHALLEVAAESGFSEHSYILCQWPEELRESDPKQKPGYDFCAKQKLPTNIAELAKERIRRVGASLIVSDHDDKWNKDVGFRVLKIDTSNMAEVLFTPDAVKQADLLVAVDNIKPDRTPEDLLFQVLVDWGVDLTLPIRRDIVQGMTVFFVDDDALVACFDTGVTEELVKELAGREPLRVVFRDNGFASDAVKINVEQIFRQLSPATDIKSI